MVVVDVWGGPGSQVLVARYLRSFDCALEIAAMELRAGYLVNLRHDATFSDVEEFDTRDAPRGAERSDRETRPGAEGRRPDRETRPGAERSDRETRPTSERETRPG